MIFEFRRTFFPIKMFWYITIIFTALYFLKLVSCRHHIGSQDTIYIFDHVKLLALKLSNFRFVVHSVVQGHFNGATRRARPRTGMTKNLVGTSLSGGGHNLPHFLLILMEIGLSNQKKI
jgi:hypothetical protein